MHRQSVHKAPFARTGKSGTSITLVVSHNVKNVHVYTHSRPSTTNPKTGLSSSESPLSASAISASKTSEENSLGGGGSSKLSVVQFI